MKSSSCAVLSPTTCFFPLFLHTHTHRLLKTPNHRTFPFKVNALLHSQPFACNLALLGATRVPFVFPVEGSRQSLGSNESEHEFLGKASHVSLPDEAEDPTVSAKSADLNDASSPFHKFFKARDFEEKDGIWKNNQVASNERRILKVDKIKADEWKKTAVEYYEPKSRDLVVGVVVSGNENKLDVNVGADMLGVMLTKEVLPFYNGEMVYLCCDLGEDAKEFMVNGKMGLVKDELAMDGGKVPGRPVVETGTILFAEVLGQTLSGRPLLSSRRMFRRLAWHRVRLKHKYGCLLSKTKEDGVIIKDAQMIKQFNEPIEVMIFEWNTGGLLTRVEGLRAFLPKAKLMSRVSSFADLKGYVGRRMFVCVRRVDEATNDLIISEREAWEKLHLKEGTLLDGTILKIFPFGAQVRIGETNRSGLLHISNITQAHIASIEDVLEVDEKVKVLVVKPMYPGKIALSIIDLESKPGLFLSDKRQVFSEAEDMAKKYRQKTAAVSAMQKVAEPPEVLPFDEEARLYANWEWFKFEPSDVPESS